ncbi:TetR family transcriptional regulator [Streptomyces triticagri]|uniref:TetR family transcriptional regulator n=1 Tax=Streptomyces triticagri TaxID=2293568 RepID=A0A372M741_9ACTN|nr:ScbR family autoregulator-binding transcription factor [Streptomyces triticagri]RFU86762.1 TetR family transcriptional regulator [Streptomyces triticagri]
MARARQERAENTRQSILDGAAAAFDAAGFGSTSLTDISRAAGVTKGALYFHFASKEALAHALTEGQFDIASALSDVERPGVQTAIDLTHQMAHSLRHDVRIRAGIRLVIELGSFTEPDPTLYNHWVSTVRSYLAPAQGRGDLKPEVDVEKVSVLVVGAFTGIQITSQVRTGREDLHDRVADMWTSMLPGLVPPRRLGRFEPAGSKQLRASLGLGAASRPQVSVG